MTILCRRSAIGLASTAALSFGLLGCGSDDSSSSGTNASASAPAAAAPAGGKHKSRIKVTEAEYWLKHTPATGQRAGGKVTFVVKNAGEIAHEFVVIKTSKQADGLLKGKEADEKGNVGEIG